MKRFLAFSTRTLAIAVIGLTLGGMTRAVASNCLVLPLYPNNVVDALIKVTFNPSPTTVANYGTGIAPEKSYFTVDIQSSPVPPVPIESKRYAAWCIDTATDIDPTAAGTMYGGALYSTCDPGTNFTQYLPNHPGIVQSPETWKKINYLINHRFSACGGNVPTMWEVQRAMWTILNESMSVFVPLSAGGAYPNFRQSVINCLVNDANANAASWEPVCGDKVGVIFNIDVNWDALAPDVQLIMIEVPYCPPEIKCPDDVTVACNESLNPNDNSKLGMPTVTVLSNCVPVNVTYSDSVTPGANCSADHIVSKIIRTWTVTDGCGQSATCDQTITVVDMTPPMISIPSGGDYGCNPTNIPTDLTIKSGTVVSDCSYVTVDVSHVDSGDCTITRTFTVTATDSCGNSTNKTVVFTWKSDKTPPSLTVPLGGDLGCNPIVPTDDSIKAGVTAVDTCGSVTVTVTHQDLPYNCSLTRTFTVTATDDCNNATNKSVVYTWTTDTTPPTITCPPDVTITNVTPQCSVYPQDKWGGSCTNGSVARILTNCFNKVYKSGYIQCGGSGYGGNAIKFTSCNSLRNFLPSSGSPDCLSYDYNNPSSCSAGSYAGNVLCLKLNIDFGDCKSISGFAGGCGDYVLNDTNSPFHGQKVRDILDVCQVGLSGGWTWYLYSWYFGCSIKDLNTLCTNINSAFDCGTPSDWCKKHLVCPTNSTTIPLPSQTGYPTVLDNCDANPSVTNVDTIIAGDCAGSYTILRKWIATDACGNTNFCTQTITVGNSKSSLCGHVFLDCDGSGDLTGKDAGMTNITVVLKNSSGKPIATNTTDVAGGYCFNNLDAGTYTVVVTPPTGYKQSAGSSTYHWYDNSGKYCWKDNDGYTHWKDSSGTDCWTANDGYSHWKDNYGRDCWKDKYGRSYSQSCSYTSTERCDNTLTVTLKACESQGDVDFAYYGTSSKISVCVNGPSSAKCGDYVTYTCTVTNTGTTCFSKGGTVYLCGGYYSCPSLSPGDSCTIQAKYYVRYSDYGYMNCSAYAYCYPSSGNTCSSQANCYTQVKY